ncbi:MAG: TraR/DksA C4-type zinc finger protein [Candidatus Kerfeldbacteria bacterium]|nr:TraR/DksA C4-type zinc finger protein [Candidatus Kerfeldbacteria bacterium]
MKKTHKEERKKTLLKEQEELRALLGRFASKDPTVKDDFHSRFPDFGTDDEDNAEEVARYQDDLSIEQNLEHALRDVDAALDAIENGSYGTCRVCGKPIEEARLAAIPSTTLCIEHKATAA